MALVEVPLLGELALVEVAVLGELELVVEAALLAKVTLVEPPLLGNVKISDSVKSSFHFHYAFRMWQYSNAFVPFWTRRRWWGRGWGRTSWSPCRTQLAAG